MLYNIFYSSQKKYGSTIPSSFSGIDIINWLKSYFGMPDVNEANHLANMFCVYGYIYASVDSRDFRVKHDGETFYRFQVKYRIIYSYIISIK